jgi:hypothetical protein
LLEYRWRRICPQHRAKAWHRGLLRGLPTQPNILIDDQEPIAWKRFIVVHPLNLSAKSIEEYWDLVDP